MALIDRAVITWKGLQGGDGVSVFYATSGPNGVLSQIHNFFVALTTIIPAYTRIEFPSQGDTIEDTTGSISGPPWVTTKPADVVGGDPAGNAAVSGSMVTWYTNGLAQSTIPGKVRLHRVRGRTYIVPLASACYSSTGSINQLTHDTISAAASALVLNTGGNLRIWAPPVHTKEGTLVRNGSSHPVTSYNVGTKVHFLSGRRD